jgi:excisionase family DNA binding protein
MAHDTLTGATTTALPTRSAPGLGRLRDEPILITVPKAAQLLGISRSAAYRCAASGDLPTAHLGGRVYVVTSRLVQLLESA